VNRPLAARLLLSQQDWQTILAHARSAEPREAVGLLGGTADGQVAQVAPLPNIAQGGAFFADPRAQYEAERGFSRLGLIPLAAYHSHPGGTATLSVPDQRLANRSLLQLVLAIGADGHIDARAYRVADAVEQVELGLATD
jgi:proteasome lid subunit RPN8/RPN11